MSSTDGKCTGQTQPEDLRKAGWDLDERQICQICGRKEAYIPWGPEEETERGVRSPINSYICSACAGD